ncbi:hypothetical protein M2451_002699 [Dysgonomonas sp. PFB1-18]|uniref:WD40/YVTN/BNR-like repeat-containing protein n=1 Tax=unclassified Dysgonomonas TaxID=2630389 RepID=UPI002476A6A7|nr:MULTISPECIES: hypothetical protein [unclassified Dysgonomonas]MDH6309415.1 hypothetical protein [Dysgonomonas sp. PF1-14]MDH6339720.1 hypothetical protein [Dysgonomonas sp. PF1-16]MDH6381368.1 hypothetical protein [Dysgonomonas sp. PFB1-18]MDH6398583.1 hypothetical protein [Dysgonomonas sp. PF1-23]
MISLIDILRIFRTNYTPSEREFQETWKSFWHKSERLPIQQVLGLNDALDNKASKEELANATTNFKGYHSSLTELLAAYPQVKNKKDFFAWVGSPYPGTVYKVYANGGAWMNTGEIPTQQEIDLADYVKVKTIVNVSQLKDEYNYEDEQDARDAVPVHLRGLGQKVIYQLKDGRKVTDTYLGVSLAQWNDPLKWAREITTIDLDYIEEIAGVPSPTNQFDIDNITPNKALSGSSGLEVTLNTTSISNYIPITKGDKIYFNSDRVIAFYDANKNLITYLKALDDTPSQDDRIIDITGDYSYMRFTIMNEWLDSTYCYLNEINNNDVEPSGENQFNKNGITPNKALNGATGLEADHLSASISNYIPIAKGDKVFFNSDRVVAFYDSNKTLITFLAALDDNPSQDNRIIDITGDYSYMRFTVMNEWLDTAYCYINEDIEGNSYSGVPASKILYNRKPINDVFINNVKKEVFVDAKKVLIGSVNLPDYLINLSYNPKIYNYELRKDITNAAILPDNMIIAAIGNKIVKYGLDGIETILLEINSVSDWRCLWCHSSGSVFFSPMNSYSENTDASNYGLYRYDGTTVTKVIQLASRQSIWGIDEDSKGNIYAGVYSLGVNNTDLYKSTDGGNTFTKLRSWSPLKHIHALYVDKLTDTLYVSLGDTYSVSQNFKSTDRGATFSPCIDSMRRQMTAIISSGKYRFFGTDHSPIGVIYRTSDDNTLEVSLNVGYYSNVFFLRRSDLTGWIYAGFKTDPSATSNLYCSVWVTKDDGDTWEIVKEINVVSAGEGFWFASNFKDGNMIVGYKLNNAFKGLGVSELVQPVYASDGITGTIIKPITYNY